MSRFCFLLAVCLLAGVGLCRAEETPAPTAEERLGKSHVGSATDDEVVAREEEQIKLDGLNVAQMKELREKSEKHAFEAEVSRMMKLIINSLYRNKEIFLRELISNSSDALDKIRFLSLTDKAQLESNPETTIRIKADKENHVLHITDTGIGMTKKDLVNNLGTIAKSGTSEFVAKMGEAQSDTASSDLIGQFGVGFYSAFLVADTVVVTSKNNDDEQHIWESNAGEFTVSRDPRGNTLGRGTCVSLYLKEEAYDFVEQDTLKTLITKYSQFINFPIYLWSSKTVEVEEPVEEEEEQTTTDADEEGKVEESKESAKTEKVEKTVWDWERMNASKPLWTRNPKEVSEEEYDEFYKSFTKESEKPGARMHFVAEGEVSFRSVLFIPKDAPKDYDPASRNSATRNVKLYVRRVFITDELTDLMPKYLDFIRGVVDSDDLPLNVSRENLQQHKLLKVIRKKLVRKALDMIKRIPASEYMHFFQQFGQSLKVGIVDDHSNRTRLAKLLRFHSSNGSEMISLTEYLERMHEKQEHIYFMAAANVEEAKKSPFVEQLLKKNYEILYLVDPIDEYCLQQVAEFEGKKFQNVAKDGLVIGSNADAAKQRFEALSTSFKPLTTYLEKTALKDRVEKVVISQRLSQSPCALVANQWGWSGNMDRIMRAQGTQRQSQESHMFEQKKIFEINPYHPLVKSLLQSVESDETSDRTRDLALVLYETAILRSGFTVSDTVAFASRVERMLRVSAGVDENAEVEEPAEDDAEEVDEEEVPEEEEVIDEPAEEPTAEESTEPEVDEEESSESQPREEL